MFAKLVQATWGDDTGEDAERPNVDEEVRMSSAPPSCWFTVWLNSSWICRVGMCTSQGKAA